MTSDQIKQVLDTVVQDINMVGDFVGIIDPALIPFVAIGKAVDRVIPGIAASVANMIEGTPPSQADLDQKAQELAVLASKEGI